MDKKQLKRILKDWKIDLEEISKFKNMNLETAVNQILKNTITWIKGNSKSRPGWVVTNFSNFFLHECNLLVCTPEFKNWRDLAYLRKPKYLSFDFDCYGDLKHVSFNVPDVYDNYNIKKLNAFLTEASQLYWHEGRVGEEEVKNIYQEVTQSPEKPGIFALDTPKVLFDVKKLQDFKF